MFEQFEKGFDLPTVLGDGGNRGGTNLEIVGQKGEFALRYLIPYLNETVEMISRLIRLETNEAIAANLGALRRDPLFDNVILCVGFEAGYKEYALCRPLTKQFVIQVASIHDHNGSFRKTK